MSCKIKSMPYRETIYRCFYKAHFLNAYIGGLLATSQKTCFSGEKGKVNPFSDLMQWVRK